MSFNTIVVKITLISVKSVKCLWYNVKSLWYNIVIEKETSGSENLEESNLAWEEEFASPPTVGCFRHLLSQLARSAAPMTVKKTGLASLPWPLKKTGPRSHNCWRRQELAYPLCLLLFLWARETTPILLLTLLYDVESWNIWWKLRVFWV